MPWVQVSDFRKSIEGNLESLRAPWLLDVFNELPASTTLAPRFTVTSLSSLPTKRGRFKFQGAIRY